MRRVVYDFIAATIARTEPQLEQFIAGHLEHPTAVPLVFTDPAASIREICDVKVKPRFSGDYSPGRRRRGDAGERHRADAVARRGRGATDVCD